MIRLSLVIVSVGMMISASVSAATKDKAAKSQKENAPVAASPECTVSIQAVEGMKFADSNGKDLKEIKIPEKCRTQVIQFNLEDKAAAPKIAMGHNLVIHEQAKQAVIVADALKAGPAAEYLPTTKDGVLGHTRTLGPNEKDSIVINAGSFKKGTDYAYVCTFVGHNAVMNGKIIFVK
ncbi:MAG: hypothetical protein H7318_06880 [Oligoflexus sp.]|nr:hypothetical protein [Oligoflexus sp.]